MSAILLAVDPQDRLRAAADPIWRAAKRRFGPLLVAVLLFHATLIAIFILGDQPNHDADLHDTEIPVEVVVLPPPPPPPPPPQEKKPEPQKPPPQKQQIVRDERPAYDAPRTANNETLKRQMTADQTHSPVKGNPSPANETKPTPSEPPKPAQNAAPEAADHTAAPDKPDEAKDAEPLDKTAPLKEAKLKQKMKQAKERATLPDDQRAAVARQLASLSPSPDYAIAAEAKVAPVSGGTEDMRYLSVLYGLIMRQQRFPASPQPRHENATVVVAFWVDESGALVHQALYRTSGYPELDHEAMSDVRRAAPFPQPPPGEAHGFIASMVFPPK